MKIARLLQLLIYLLNVEQVTAQTLAERFSVSKRTIYRDIVNLEEAGIPIIVTQGAKGGFSLMNDYKLRSVTFTTAEKKRLLDLLAMEESLILTDDLGRSLAEKIKFLKVADTEESHHISVSQGTIQRAEIEDSTKIKVNQVNQAIIDNQALEILYVDGKGEITTREVIPEEVILKDGSWYLAAYCGLRQAGRLFKLTRIQELTIIPRIRAIPKIKEEKVKPEGVMRSICLEFSPSELGKLYDFFSPENISLGLTGEIIVTFEEDVEQSMLSFLLMFGNKVKVLSPESLIKAHCQAIKAMTNIY